MSLSNQVSLFIIIIILLFVLPYFTLFYFISYFWALFFGLAPGKVQSLTVTQASNHSLNISWTKPSHECSISYYNVTHQPICFDQCMDPVDPEETYNITKDTKVTIKGLQPYSTYNISVTAWSGGLKGYTETNSGQTSESSKFTLYMYKRKVCKCNNVDFDNNSKTYIFMSAFD